MDTRLIAKVRVPKNNGKHGIGTAYPIAKNLLLTARHVVVFDDRNEEKSIEIHWLDMDCSTNETEVVYQGKDEIDVALIKCKFPEQIQTPTMTVLSHQYPHENMRWKSMGYPTVSKEENDKHHKEPAMGTFFPRDQKRAVIRLKMEGDALKKEYWKGMSGAPVFCDHTLRAVISDTPIKLKERVTAILIPHLLENDKKFRKLVGFDIEETLDFSSALNRLKGNHTLVALINECLVDKGIKQIESASLLLGYLKKLAVPELLDLILKAQEKCSDYEEQLIQELGEFLEEMLPRIFDPNLAKQIQTARNSQNPQIVPIDYVTPVSAEALMACSDNRDTNFEVKEVGKTGIAGWAAKPGKYMLSMPPESGSQGNNQQIRDIRYDLFNRSGKSAAACTDINRYLYDEIIPDDVPKETDDQYIKEDVQDRLEVLASNKNQPSYYWVMHLPRRAEDKAARLELAEHIKQEFPQISLLILSRDRVMVRQERKDNDILSRILKAARNK